MPTLGFLKRASRSDQPEHIEHVSGLLVDVPRSDPAAFAAASLVIVGPVLLVAALWHAKAGASIRLWPFGRCERSFAAPAFLNPGGLRSPHTPAYALRV